jgi:hypothetical protein
LVNSDKTLAFEDQLRPVRPFSHTRVVRSGRVIFIYEEAVHLLLGCTQTELSSRGIHKLVHYRKANGTPPPIEECAMNNIVHAERKVLTASSTGSNVKRVLLMVDDARIRCITDEMLNHLGIDVETAKSGEEAVTLCRRSQATGQGFHAVILDLVVPRNMGGEVTMKKLPVIHPDVKGLVSTGVIPKTRY